MKKLKTLLPSEKRIIDVGWTHDGRLVLCFKYFEGPDKYDGYFPFSFFVPPLVTRKDLEEEIVKHFGFEYLPPYYLKNITGVDVLKSILVHEFEDAAG